MGPDERLQLDYDQTNQLVRDLHDVRFKLLAFVPTIAGAAVALVGGGRPSGAELLGVGLLGLLATLGVLLYELSNAHVYQATLQHAQALERCLGFGTGADHAGVADLLVGSGPVRPGLTRLAPELAVGLVYGAALAGWSYLVAWGVLRLAGASGARAIGGAIGVAVGVLVLEAIRRLGQAPVAGPASAAVRARSTA